MSTDHLPNKKRMRPGVKALIVHEGKILMIHEMVKRDGTPKEITDFPGGGIDYGEDLKDALIREVKEEVQLDIKIGKTVGAWDFVIGKKAHQDEGKWGVHIVCIGYQCEVVGEINIDVTKNPADENIYDAKWYTREYLLENKETMLRHQGIIDAVTNLDI